MEQTLKQLPARILFKGGSYVYEPEDIKRCKELTDSGFEYLWLGVSVISEGGKTDGWNAHYGSDGVSFLDSEGETIEQALKLLLERVKKEVALKQKKEEWQESIRYIISNPVLEKGEDGDIHRSRACEDEDSEKIIAIVAQEIQNAKEELLQDMYKKSAGAIIPDFIEEYAQSIGITLTNNKENNEN